MADVDNLSGLRFEHVRVSQTSMEHKYNRLQINDDFRVSTLGQPLEVTKTTMAANRKDGFAGALTRIWNRGGVLGCKS